MKAIYQSLFAVLFIVSGFILLETNGADAAEYRDPINVRLVLMIHSH
ncbi:hypothetical protein [Geomicrobium sp. JCM 19039]|nr:hypothetical protein [Geomicrobium sp. JCM 19039]